MYLKIAFICCVQIYVLIGMCECLTDLIVFRDSFIIKLEDVSKYQTCWCPPKPIFGNSTNTHCSEMRTWYRQNYNCMCELRTSYIHSTQHMSMNCSNARIQWESILVIILIIKWLVNFNRKLFKQRLPSWGQYFAVFLLLCRVLSEEHFKNKLNSLSISWTKPLFSGMI